MEAWVKGKVARAKTGWPFVAGFCLAAFFLYISAPSAIPFLALLVQGRETCYLATF
jgi:hypothetical protein